MKSVETKFKKREKKKIHKNVGWDEMKGLEFQSLISNSK